MPKPTPSLAHFVWLLHPLEGATPAARPSRFRGVSHFGRADIPMCAIQTLSGGI